MDKRHTIVQRYLDHPVCLGGEWMPRARAIQEMQNDGLTPREIDRWMQGQELAQRLHPRRP